MADLTPNEAIDLIAKLKKCNKKVKEQKANEAGYANYFLYLGALTEIAKNKEEPISIPDDSPTMSFSTPTSDAPQDITDMVIAFDTTGSMRRYINNVKHYVADLIPKLLLQNPNLQISIVAFGDYADMTSWRGRISGSQDVFGPAYQVCPLSRDTNVLIDFVKGALDTSGDDSDEFYELVLRKIRMETDWRMGAIKTVLLIADADPHLESWYKSYKRDFIDWRLEATNLAEDDITVDTLSIKSNSSNRSNWYKELSDTTNGLHLPFSDASQTSELIEMTAYARGGDATRKAFFSMATSSVVTNSTELKETAMMYKGMVEERDGK